MLANYSTSHKMCPVTPHKYEAVPHKYEAVPMNRRQTFRSRGPYSVKMSKKKYFIIKC